jgi:hypothetical protein
MQGCLAHQIPGSEKYADERHATTAAPQGACHCPATDIGQGEERQLLPGGERPRPTSHGRCNVVDADPEAHGHPACMLSRNDFEEMRPKHERDDILFLKPG